MDKTMEYQQGPTKFIDPRIQEIQASTTNLYNNAIEEFGLKMPLAFVLYNQIRYYEDFGKLKIGYSIQGKESLANQFGVTVKQIEKAYDNLTNKYKLGSWVVSDAPIFRRVKKVWVSNVRQQRMSLEDTLKLMQNSYSVGENPQKLLQRRSKTPTVEELPTEVPPLSESNKKVNNNIISISINKPSDEIMSALFFIGHELGECLTVQRRIEIYNNLKPAQISARQLKAAFYDYRDSEMSNKSVNNFFKPKVFSLFVQQYLHNSQKEDN